MMVVPLPLIEQQIRNAKNAEKSKTHTNNAQQFYLIPRRLNQNQVQKFSQANAANG